MLHSNFDKPSGDGDGMLRDKLLEGDKKGGLNGIRAVQFRKS